MANSCTSCTSSVNLDTSGADQADPSYTWLTNPDHTANDLLNNEQYNPNNNQMSFMQQVAANVGPAIKDMNKGAPEGNANPYAAVMGNGAFGISGGFARLATIGNFEKGHMYIGQEQTKPPVQGKKTQMESPTELYDRWHSMMREFAYSKS